MGRDSMSILDRIFKAGKGQKIDLIRPENATREEVANVEKIQEMSDSLVEAMKADIGDEPLSKILKMDLCKEYIKVIGKTFEKVKQATNALPISLEEMVSTLNGLDETYNLMLSMNPAIGVQEFYAYYNYWLEGQRDYYIAENLCKRLKASHIREIPTELLGMPHRAFRMFIPDKIMPFTTGDNRTIFIRELHVIDYVEAGKRVLMVYHICLDDVGYFFITIDEKEVHQCVDKSIAKMWADIKRVNSKIHTFTDGQDAEMRAMFEFVVKCILYITGAKADIEYVNEAGEIQSQLNRVSSGSKRAKLERRLVKAKKGYLVGHKIVLSREERKMYENIDKGIWTLNHRFVVQGHYRNQAYGEKHSLRRIIFIEPFYKGPELADEINSPHIVK